MAVDTKTMDILRTEPDISEGLDLSWMDQTGERGMTARPGRMKEMITIDITRPRSVDVLTSAPFAALKRRIMALVHEEAVRAMG